MPWPGSDVLSRAVRSMTQRLTAKQVYLREEESTTGIGEGIAIPHGKGDCVKQAGTCSNGN